MKKITSLFQRNYDGDRLVRNEVVPGAEWVLAGEGEGTRKFDGTCCMVDYPEGKKLGYPDLHFETPVLYKRYDAKEGRTPPPDFIAAQEPDPVTKHWPGWVPVGEGPDDRWHREAFERLRIGVMGSEYCLKGTFELCGPRINGNPEVLAEHVLIPHYGNETQLDPQPPRDFEGIKAFLLERCIEGIVWHHPDGRMVKIKRKDFTKQKAAA